MSVRFIIGRAGTGKSRRCFDAIADHCAAAPLVGAPIYWVLPRQATFTAERELTCGSGLGGFSRVRVVSFAQLGRDVLEECGGVAIPEITAIGRQMVLGHLLRKHRDQLRFFKSVAHQTGLAAELDSTFAEFERCGKSQDDLTELVKTLEEAAAGAVAESALSAKLHDLHLLYGEYGRFLGQERLDPHRRLQQVLTCIDTSRRLRGAIIYVDGFYDFTDYERKFLVGLAKVCQTLEIALTLDPNSAVLADAHRQPDELGVFHPTEETYRRMWFALNEADVPVDPPVILRTTYRFKSTAARHLETCLFGNHPKPAGEAEGIKLIEAPDRRAEVDAAARHIQSLVRDGLRYRQIAVLVRKLEDYQELIDAGFREHGLPWFVDRRRSAAHHPLIQFTRSLPALALHDWDHDAILTLLKSGLIPLAADVDAPARDAEALDRADQLENYVLEHRIRGRAWADEAPWTFRRDLTRAEEDDSAALEAARDEAAEMDRLRRRLVEPLMPLIRLLRTGQPTPLRMIVIALLNIFEACKVRETLARWMSRATGDGETVQDARQFEQRAEHAQVWNELIDLLDQLVDLLGDQPVGAADFVEILESGLESFDLALTPPTVDQVLVGSVDRTRTPGDVRATIVLGLHEGGFPHCPREGSILGDIERRTLRRHKIELDPETHQRLFDERFLGYIAFTRASERLCLMRPTADDDRRPLAPSSFWNMVRGSFPMVVPEQIPRDSRSEIDCIGTPRQLVTALMRWARESEDATIPTDKNASKYIGVILQHRHPECTHEGSQVDRAYPECRDASRSTALHDECPVDLTMAQNHAGNVGEQTNQTAWPALYQKLATYECRGDAIDAMRYRAWRALSYDNAARLSKDVSSQLFSSPLRSSVSRVETFATCPFKHFARYGLKLRQRDEEDVTAIDLGNVYHGILEKLVREIVKRREDFATAPQQFTDERIRAYAESIGQSLRNELLLSSARNHYLLEHVQRTLGQVIHTQREAARRGKFKPWKTELAFGIPDRAQAEQSLAAFQISTPKGNVISLSGKIDRVDLLEDQAAFAVIDYKLSGNKLELYRVYHGLSLQLLTYLLVLQSASQSLGQSRLTPAAAFYVKLLRKLETVAHPDDATPTTEPEFHLKEKPRGIFDANFLGALDSELTGGKSDVVHAQITKDGSLGKRSDGVAADSFAALLQLVQHKLGALADRIIGGDISVSPYRIGTSTPCPQCEYRSVCRFDPARENYNTLPKMSREEVIELARKLGGDDE